MAKYDFSEAERQAVINVHGTKCYICNILLDLSTFEVDHVIPESLQEDPSMLKQVTQQLGLPSGFSLNSAENWLPACRHCNGIKSSGIWLPSLLIQLILQRTMSKAAKVRDVTSKLVSSQTLLKAVSAIKKAASIITRAVGEIASF